MIPEGFKERMKKTLGEDDPAFIAAIEDGEAVRGMRINLLKAGDSTDIPYPTTRLDYLENGFILNTPDRMGQDPLHHCGAIYMQDPGAMATAAAIDIEPEWWVADLCAAPGGKSSQIAERLTEGFLLSNEYVPKRAKILVGNLERMGVARAIVTSLDTEELAKLYDGAFDLVVADAPCSGEGMFRKSSEALEDWSEGNVALCAERQTGILENAVKLTRAGGYLLYSTCTYSLEENEMQVYELLRRHEELSLVPVKAKIAANTANGIDFTGGECPELELCRRFYPHVSPGEGQFIALFKKNGVSAKKQSILYKDASTVPSKAELAAYEGFVKESLTERPAGRLARLGERLVILPEGVTVPPRSVFSAGVLLGEIKGSTVIPSHHFYSCFGRLFKNTINLTRGDTLLEKYLRGEEIPTDKRGYCAVLFEGAPLGGGKASGGALKNHYPKGLRNK